MFHVLLVAAMLATGQSLEVKCEFNHITWENMDNAYTCSAVDFVVQSPDETVEKVTGTHEAGKTNNDVKKVNIAQQICLFIPFGFEKFFPNLEGLRIAQSRLIRLRQIDISVHPKLRNCDMFNNWLDVINSDIFAKNLDLEYLYFGDNQIRSIGIDILKPLKKLKKVVFQGNACIKVNADTKIMIEKLQEMMNKECGTISEYEKSRGEMASHSVAIQQLIEQNDHANKQAVRDELAELRKNENALETMLQERNSSAGMTLLWVALSVVIVAGLVIGIYLKKYRVKRPIMSDTIGILPAYTAMENRTYDDGI